MFCPKCGNTLPDDAAFCGSCGNKIEPRPSVATPADPAASSTPGIGTAKPATAVVSKPTNGAAIAAGVLAIIAMLTTLMPWFETSSLMANLSSQASGLVSGASSLFGGSSSLGNSLKFDDSYTLYSLLGFADTYKDYVDIYGSAASLLGVKSSSLKATADAMGLVASWFLAFWIVSLALSIWGTIKTFTKGETGLLRAGCILMIVLSLNMYGFGYLVGSDTGSVTIYPTLCLILAIVALLCTAAVKKKAAIQS